MATKGEGILASAKTVLEDMARKTSDAVEVAKEKTMNAVTEFGTSQMHFAFGALAFQSCVEELMAHFSTRGFRVQRFEFAHDGRNGVLVQIANGEDEWKRNTAKTLAGQQIAVSAKFRPNGDDVDVDVDSGKWLDKVATGVLSWTFFAPLLVLPAIGVIRQKALISNVSVFIQKWFDDHKAIGTIS